MLYGSGVLSVVQPEFTLGMVEAKTGLILSCLGKRQDSSVVLGEIFCEFVYNRQ